MTRLSAVRRELSGLRARRKFVRLATAWCGLALIVLWVLTVAFLLDFSLKMDLAQRAAFLALYTIVSVWAVRKYVLPWFGHHETDIDMALLVEKHQKIDSELVAALQFETEAAADWGSPRLRTAVVEYVAEYGRNWNFLEGVPTQPLRVRGALLAVTLLLVGGAVALWPGHVTAFLQRFLLGSSRYPSQTRIVAVELKSELGDVQIRDKEYRGPFGKKVTFQFKAEGVLPEDGRLEMVSEGERRAPLTIKKITADNDREAVYEASLDRLLKPVRFQAYLHDTWTDPQDLVVIPTPLVELELSATAPEYARGVVASEAPTRDRQISVLQGSQVQVHLKCANKKLASAQLLIKVPGSEKGEPGEWTATPLVRSQEKDQEQTWQLAAQGNPLASVQRELQYKIQVTDEDGLSADGDIGGTVRVKLDRKPILTASASAGTTRVVPQANPKFNVAATDDFALAKLAVHVEIVRQAEGSGIPEAPTADRPDQADLQIPLPNAPLLVREGQLPYNLQKFVLPLEPFRLAKGDQVKVFFEGTDYRGENVPGETNRSDAITLTVTDDTGIIAGITERDELGVRQFDEINKTQLGTGGSK